MNVRIAKTRVTSREGVNAAQTFFERAGCVFQEVAQQNDFGKDAYVDLAIGDILTHLCVALQIKSGESFRTATGDFSIPIEKHAANWRLSTVPVFGLVYDPADQLLRWADLTGYLQAHPQDEAGTIRVPREAILDEESLHGAFGLAVATYAATGSRVTLNLLSSNDLLQTDAVYDAWALGRQDARYFIILRRLLLELRPMAMRRAIAALSHLAPHPDIFWTANNWIPKEIEEQALPSFRWSPEEIAHMLRVIEVEEWGRGTLGQSFDVLMYEDPNVVTKLRAAVALLAKDDNLDIAVRAVTLALSHSHNARGELAYLTEHYPVLQSNEWFQDISEYVQEESSFSLY